MKNLLSFLLILCTIHPFFAQKDEDVLMTINNKNVTVGEFKYIYEKNNGKDANYSKKSLSEYLDLYSKFKLKVERAKELRIDTIQSLKEELAGYKKQLANSYLMDKEVTDQLVKELYGRVSEDVRFSHIMLSFNEKNTPAEWEEGLVKIKKFKEEIERGKSFEAVVKEFSEDKSSREKNGDMGFFTAMLPTGFYELEQALYGTPIGKISAPIKTKIGYHLIKVTEKRPAKGQVEIAHILIRKENAKSDPKVKIEEVYGKLKAGSDFSEMASEYSEDVQTSKTGGLLKPFGIGTYESKFEEAAFSLKSDGEYTMPIETKSGWHILKRIRKINPQSESYAQFKKINESKIKKDERFENARLSMINDIQKSTGYKEDISLFGKFKTILNEEFLTYKWTPETTDPMYSQKLITLGNYSATLKDFVDFAKKNTRQRLRFDKSQTTPGAVADILLKDFGAEKTVEFEQINLENKYPDFKALLREYEEGILLFEATKQAVWDKANQDSVGLEKFFAGHNTEYVTDEKAKVLTYAINTTDTKLIEKIMKEASKNDVEKVMKKFNKKDVILSYQEETLEKANPKFGGMNWQKDAMSKFELNSKTNVYQFKKILEIFPSRPKTLKEAKGYVVADFQDHLEKLWIEELKKAYAVKINDDILGKLTKIW